MKDLFSVSGKIAVVTGGSRGIGAMMARGLLENGAEVFISARKDSELKAAEAELGRLGLCTAVRADLSTDAGIAALVDAVSAKRDRLDILINNAGAAWGESIDTYPQEGWDKVMNINTRAVFFLTQKFLPLLRKSASAEAPARVVNIASINGITNPLLPNYAYSASKAAVIQLTRHLAADLVKEHINVNAIAPGFFPSKMTAFAMQAGEEAFAEGIPRGRVGRPEDAAGAAIYLTSKASAWVTGHTLVVDGGQVAAAG